MAIAGASPWQFLAKLFAGGDRRGVAGVRDIEERRRGLHRATEQWVSLLRSMEAEGQTADPRYETYYQAYLRAKEQEKQADLAAFNARQGFSK